MSLRTSSVVLSALVVVFCTTLGAKAAPVWGTDASGALTGTRTSAAGGGVYATEQWANGGYSISWNVTQLGNDWKYVYTISANTKAVSHTLLEVTQDAESPFTWDAGLSSPLSSDSPKAFSPSDPGNSNPLLPNPLYGVKFDFGGTSVTYTLVTDHAPVWGVFYSKDGVNRGGDVVAWSNALSYSDYKTNASLTANDFIVRPDGVTIPEPASLGLLGAGAACLVFRRRRTA